MKKSKGLITSNLQSTLEASVAWHCTLKFSWTNKTYCLPQAVKKRKLSLYGHVFTERRKLYGKKK